MKINTNKIILGLDPRGIIVSGGTDVVKRQNIYGKNLYKQEFNYIILSTANHKSVSIQSLNFLEIHQISKPTLNAFKFARSSAKYVIDKKWEIELLVAGDPWESYWSAYLLSKFLNKNIPIQIQVHGDIADPRWRRINLRNRIRYLLAKLALPKATSVRAVTKYQAENLEKVFGIRKEKIVVVPVPINMLNKTATLKIDRPKTIGLLGRIHQDRGVWEFIKLVRVLNLSYKDFKVVVIGDGPSKEKFLRKLLSVIPKNRVTYLGQLPESELRKAWKRIGVLVSMAPVESYGRVMRESLIAGVPVWATASAGVKDLMDNCKKGEVRLLDLNKSDTSLEKDFNSLLKTKVSSDFSKRFIKENNTYAAKLANSWINVIKKSK